MNFIERKNIDCIKWDKLVSNNPDSSFFSYSWYLDATAENWAILIEGDYTAGIAIPYTKRAGIEIAYTPIFVRYLECFGVFSDLNLLEKCILERFKVVQINFKEPILNYKSESFVFQTISSSEEPKISTQAKRSLKKAVSSGLNALPISNENSVMEVVKNELNGKFRGIDDKSLSTLTKLIENAKFNGVLKVIGVSNETDFLGGIFCLESERQILYLKGAVSDECKKNGGMYLALKSMIEQSQIGGKLFDFGGSRVQGVRSFNKNLGGQDCVYYSYSIDNGPSWFKFVKRIRNKWLKG